MVDPFTDNTAFEAIMSDIPTVSKQPIPARVDQIIGMLKALADDPALNVFEQDDVREHAARIADECLLHVKCNHMR